MSFFNILKTHYFEIIQKKKDLDEKQMRHTRSYVIFEWAAILSEEQYLRE